MKRIFVLIVFVCSLTTGWSQTSGPLTRIIPQIAAGSFDSGRTRYSTVIEIINPNVTSVTLSGNFYNEDGTASNITFTTTSTAAPTISNGTIPQITLDPNKVLVITATTAASGNIAWGRIVTNSSVSYATFFELRDARSSALVSRVGVAASPSNMSKFLIPRVRNAAAGFEAGFAIVNTASTSASMTATLKDAAGATIASRVITLNGNSHEAMFTQELFELTNEPGGTNYHYIVFDGGNAAQFAAIALAFEGGTQTSFPVDVLR